jgi:hypothetical protein
MKGIERRSRPRALVLALLVAVLGCVPSEAVEPAVVVGPAAPPPVPAVTTTPAVSNLSSEQERAEDAADESAVVLVVFDGVRWQEIFEGIDARLAASAGIAPSSPESLTPRLHALLDERGAALGAPEHGPAMTASGPNFVSLPGYTELFTGHRTHPCFDNDCPPARSPTLFDEARSRARHPGDVAVFSSWDRIERAATTQPENLVLSTGRSRLTGEADLKGDSELERLLSEGHAAAAFPGHDDFRPDRFTAALALRYLETKRPRLMFLGLGEPDEFAHRGDYAGYVEALRGCDAALGQLFDVLDRMGTRGRRTTVLVTADHGRARDYRVHGGRFPESARVWLVAAGGAVTARGLVRSERPHHLADVAPTVRKLLGLPADAGPSRGEPLGELFGSGTLAMAMAP